MADSQAVAALVQLSPQAGRVGGYGRVSGIARDRSGYRIPDPGAPHPRRGGATGASEVCAAREVGLPEHALDRGVGTLPRPGSNRLANGEWRSSWLRDQVESRPVDSVGLPGGDVQSCVGPGTLVVCPQHIEAALQLVPKWWGVLLVRGSVEAVSLDPFRPAAENPDQDLRALVELLWRDEAMELLAYHNAAAGVRSKRRPVVWDRVCEVLDVTEIRSASDIGLGPVQRPQRLRDFGDVMDGSNASPHFG